MFCLTTAFLYVLCISHQAQGRMAKLRRAQMLANTLEVEEEQQADSSAAILAGKFGVFSDRSGNLATLGRSQPSMPTESLQKAVKEIPAFKEISADAAGFGDFFSTTASSTGQISSFVVSTTSTTSTRSATATTSSDSITLLSESDTSTMNAPMINADTLRSQGAGANIVQTSIIAAQNPLTAALTSSASILQDSATTTAVLTTDSLASVDVNLQSASSNLLAPPSGTISSSVAATAEAAQASSSAFQLPGRQLAVLPIGLGIFAGISAIAFIIVGAVTYERRKYRKQYRARKMAERISVAAGFKDMAERRV